MRALQKALAKEITIRVHSEEEYVTAKKATELLFGKSTTEDLISLPEKTLLSVFEGVPMAEITKEIYKNTTNVTDLLSEKTNGVIFSSKGEARRMISGGGVSINKNKIGSADEQIEYNLLKDKYLLVQKGKKNYYLIKVV